EDVVPKYLIHVACADRIQPIQRFAIAFNRESDKYRVVIDNYNTYEDGTDSFALLKNDIAVGNIPDVIVCGYDFDFDVLDRQGLFRDFYSYMDADGETLNRDVFLPCALRPFENQKGELHGLIAGFNLVSAAADKAVLGGKTSVTAADLLSIAEGLKDGQYLYALRMYEDEKPAEMLLEKLLTLQFDSYIDYKNAACHFDDGDFADLLRLCKTAPVLNLAAMDMEDVSVSTLLKNGDLVFLDLPWFESPSSYLQAKYYDFAESEMVLTGYPTVSGNTCGTVIEPAYRYTITKTSPVAEGAWQFIKRTFGTFEGDRFNGYSGESFSPCRPVLDSVFEKESRRFYSFSEWGWGCSEGSPEDDLDKLWQETLEQCAMSGEIPGHMTAEDEAFLRKLLDSVTSAAHNDTEISAIIKEEASAYFAGAKSVEEVVKLIQSRVSLYVSEVYG
ncbi:MAG: hypothetical protein MJ175_09300, partial [Clostridia bacterium]|nr:hypothetical protein [Clostridia bacterium]